MFIVEFILTISKYKASLSNTALPKQDDFEMVLSASSHLAFIRNINLESNNDLLDNTVRMECFQCSSSVVNCI